MQAATRRAKCDVGIKPSRSDDHDDDESQEYAQQTMVERSDDLVTVWSVPGDCSIWIPPRHTIELYPITHPNPTASH